MSPSRQPDADRVRAAHADAWAAHGRFREPAGGGDLRLPGIRVMASGLPHPQWNNGDIDDPAAVDLDTVVSRGASTTASPSWTGCRSVRASAWSRTATPADEDTVVRIDAAAHDAPAAALDVYVDV